MNKEEYYDQNIAPKLLEIGKECENAGLTFIAVCEYEGGDYGGTRTIQPNSGYPIRLVDLAVQCEGNVDSLMFAVMRHAREHGHSSIILKQLGIPERPTL